MAIGLLAKVFIALSVTSFSSYKFFSKETIESYPETLQRYAEEINAMGTSWKAKVPLRFKDHTKEQMKMHMGLFEKDELRKDELEQMTIENQKKWNNLAVEVSDKYIGFEQLPTSFDAREKWSKCKTLFDIRDQSRCGSCWAVAASVVMSARLCIHSPNQSDQRFISASDVLGCCHKCGKGCDGGQEDMAYQQWVERGWVTGGDYEGFIQKEITSCKPYPFPMCAHHTPGILGIPDCKPQDPWFETPKCTHECQDGYPKKYWQDITRGKMSYTVRGEKNMMIDLVTNGPMSVSITLYDDFFLFTEGVYHHVIGESHGLHAVNLFGYGEENGEKYWLIQNEWNQTWGDNGYIKIKRGVNEIGVENDASSALPDESNWAGWDLSGSQDLEVVQISDN